MKVLSPCWVLLMMYIPHFACEQDLNSQLDKAELENRSLRQQREETERQLLDTQEQMKKASHSCQLGQI